LTGQYSPFLDYSVSNRDRNTVQQRVVEQLIIFLQRMTAGEPTV